MAPRYDDYESDDSTLVNSRRGERRRTRYRSPSRESSHYSRPRHNRRHSFPADAPPREEKSSKAGTFVKLGLGVVFVQVVATCISEWMKNKQEENERRHRREKRRAFEKAKAKRRREEEKNDREVERRERDGDSEIEREVIIREGRRITYVPMDADVEREESPEIRGYLPPPPAHDSNEHDDWVESDGWDDRRSRAHSVGARSRSRFGRSKSVYGEDRDGRSRSRPAVDVPR